MEKRILISRKQIAQRVSELAKQISNEYKNLPAGKAGKRIVLLGVLDGAYIFTADLSRELFNAGLSDFEVSFIGVSSYTSKQVSSGVVTITKDLTIDITNKYVILIEDIIDTGLTLGHVLSLLKKRSPASIKTCVLLSKKGRREVHIPVGFIGFEIGNKWVEGYGLDTKYTGRGNPDIVEVLNRHPQ